MTKKLHQTQSDLEEVRSRLEATESEKVHFSKLHETGQTQLAHLSERLQHAHNELDSTKASLFASVDENSLSESAHERQQQEMINL